MTWVRDEHGHPQLVHADPATCHPWRKNQRDGRCRNCLAAAMPALDPLPARVAGAVQHAGPVVPTRCSKCGAAWEATGDYVSCYACGTTWFRTSEKIIRPPRSSGAKV